MDRNLLFIGKYPEIREELHDVLEEKMIETDIVDNGTDAMELMKKKEYQVVITGLVLDGFNGDQILSYIYTNHPNTICMIYTHAISAVQLEFYLNKRNVFRVFLRPVNFRQEFMQALEEAYEFSDLKKHDRETRQQRLDILEENRRAIIEMEKLLEHQNKGWKDFQKFSELLLNFTAERYGADLSQEQRIQYLSKEKILLSQICEKPNAFVIASAHAQARQMLE